MGWRTLCTGLALAFLSATGFAQSLPPDRFLVDITSLRAELPPATEADDARIGSQLFELLTLLEPLVFEQREPAASLSFAQAALGLSSLSEFSRNGRSRQQYWSAVSFAAEALAPAERARLELELARAMQSAGNLDEACQVMESTLEHFDPIVLPWALTLHADMERARGNAIESLERLEAAEAALHSETPFHRQVRTVLYGLRGLIHLELGINDRAAYWFAKERALAEELQVGGLSLSVLVHSAALVIANPSLPSAVEELEAALDAQLVKTGDRAARANLRSMLARLKAYRALAEGADTVPIAAELRLALEDPALLKEESVDARLYLARVLIAHGELDQAFDEVSKLRGDHLLIELKNAPLVRARESGLIAAVAVELELARKGVASFDTLRTLETAFDDMLEQWERTPVRPGGVGFLNSQERLTVLDVLIRAQLAGAEGEAEVRAALENLIRAQSRGTLARELGATSCTVEEVRSELVDADSLVLIYLPTPLRTHLFALRTDSLEYFELAGEHEIDVPRREFQALLQTPPADDETRLPRLASLGHELSRLLLPQRVRELHRLGRALTIIGAENLGWLPFEALPFDSLPLWMQAPISYLPSLPIGMKLLERDRAQPAIWDRDLLLLADPTIDPSVHARWPELEQLALDSVQLSELASGFEPSRIETLSADAATPEAFFQSLAAHSPRLLHVFAHGVRDPERERSAGLVLAGTPNDSGILWPEHIESNPMPPVVLLSACGAARGPKRFGDDGVSHLGGAFLRAGTTAVVLSRTDVDSRVARVLSEQFTRALSQGATSSEALHYARREIAGTISEDPFYTSLVHAVGLTHRQNFPGNYTPATEGETFFSMKIFLLAGLATMALVIALMIMRGSSSRT